MLSLSTRACSEVDTDEEIVSWFSLVRTVGIRDPWLPYLSKSGFERKWLGRSRFSYFLRFRTKMSKLCSLTSLPLKQLSYLPREQLPEERYSSPLVCSVE